MKQPFTRTNQQIRSEIYKMLERLNASPNELAIVGSWGDTMSDDEILSMLIDVNRDISPLAVTFCEVDPEDDE